MPNWDYFPMEDEEKTLSLSLGRWVVTDGAYFTKDSVEVERLTFHDGFLDVTQDPDGLELLTLGYKVETPIAKRDDKILVIDSGEMVFCCVDAFTQGGITLTNHRENCALDRVTYAYFKAARLAGKHSNAMLIYDANQDCIGIIARPKWGDGAYRLEFENAGEFQLLRAHLGESC
ncbi:MAG: hypothetical protein JXB10_04255 [Pirellulales bacterium]|nr:hypothetical protein [Pirellulales bacterium]